MDAASERIWFYLIGLSIIAVGVAWILRASSLAEYYVRMMRLGPEWTLVVRIMIYVTAPVAIVLGLVFVLSL